MAGVGRRFLNAGYIDPKPLVIAGDRSLIEHIVGFFPAESNFLFICNQDHVDHYHIDDEIRRICPSGTIVVIPKNKLGPVYTTLQASDYIDDDDEVILQYCDVRGYWDYESFLEHIRDRESDGVAVANRGFHPHMLGTTQYAFMKDDGNQFMLEIQEKKPYTDNRMEEYASIGTHYFRSGKMMRHYFQILIDREMELKGEYYVSLVYNLLVEDGLTVSIYEVQHMLLWGTPYDVEVYNKWDRYFRYTLTEKPKGFSDVNVLVPMAGAGSRFAGYEMPKPLIDIAGKPMYVQSVNHMVGDDPNIVFVCQRKHAEQFDIDKNIGDNFHNSKVVLVDGLTEGQACTCELGILNGMDSSDNGLLILSCDNGVILDHDSLLAAMEGADCLVFGFKNDPSSRLNPNMYSWIDIDNLNNVKKVSMKNPISGNPWDDYAVVGSFYFRNNSIFINALNKLYANKGTTNNEYYVDNLVNEIIREGLVVKMFPVEQFICWGTPDDLNVYKYWQSFFHKYDKHPYDIRRDIFSTDNQKILSKFIDDFYNFDKNKREKQ